MINLENFVEIKRLVKDLRHQFARIETKPWSFKKGCMELFVQIGHLSQILNVSGNYYIEKGRNIVHVEDEISDCIFQVIALMLFFNLNDEKIFSSFQMEIQEKNENEIFLNLILVASQLMESIMRIEGDRFSCTRKPFYPSESEFISLKLSEAISLLKKLAELKKIHIINAFKRMHQDTVKFLSNFHTKNNDDVLHEFKEVKEKFNLDAFKP